ncbi:MAG TPA: hypothetical protein VMC09_01075 [Anaerolineales bacterium]|nr:hypothetical protein [Anaerolineales bacterium]
MAFLTIFTAPKPFTNPHINIIQRNAVQAWTRLEDVDVILIGDEPGIPEVASEFGLKHVAQVKRDDNGVPLVSAVMEIGHQQSDSPILCYSNADMLLMTDLVTAARQVSRQAKDFLMVGQRWNLDMVEPMDFRGDWEARLRERAYEQGKLFSPWGIDYFVFPRHLFTQVPDFTIGRVGWDNWMVYHARTSFGMAIDATRDVLAVHQNHDYSHLPGQKLYGTDVARSNIAKAGGRRCIYNTLDTNRELVKGKISIPEIRLVRLLRRLERIFINDEGRGWRWEISLRLQKIQKALPVRPRR